MPLGLGKEEGKPGGMDQSPFSPRTLCGARERKQAEKALSMKKKTVVYKKSGRRGGKRGTGSRGERGKGGKDR